MKTVTAMALVLAVFASGITAADAHYRKKGTHSHYSKVKPQVRGYISRGGGYAAGYENETLLQKNGPYGFYPNYDDRNFWERVQSSPFDSRPGVSAF